jgi:hypothetical protein
VDEAKQRVAARRLQTTAPVTKAAQQVRQRAGSVLPAGVEPLGAPGQPMPLMGQLLSYARVGGAVVVAMTVDIVIGCRRFGVWAVDGDDWHWCGGWP